jgi:cell division protein FtsZ
VFHFSNEEVIQIAGGEISLNNALEIANRHLCESVLGLSRMLIEPGLLNVSFGDLQASMKGRHSLGSTLCVEGVGEDLAADVMKKILSHPAARMGKALSEATTLLVHLSGGENLSLAEINTVIESISLHASANDVIVGASGSGSDNVLQVILVIVQETKSNNFIMDTNVSKNLPENEAPDLSYPENFMPSGENSYMDLGSDSTGANRVRFAYTPPAPAVETITPEMKDSLLEAAAKQEPNRKKRKEIKQEMLPLEVISKGRFEKSEPTIHKGEDLDQPTYIRRGMMLN